VIEVFVEYVSSVVLPGLPFHPMDVPLTLFEEVVTPLF
jgi:hypothetical protein